MNIGRTPIVYFFLFAIYASLVLGTMNFSFFWDTVQLGSKHAHYFYENNFKSLTLPNDIDSGHIPALGLYLAIVWKIFGKSLAISHIAMLPFVLGIFYQTIQLSRQLFPGKWAVALR